jgi:hypothetical protein
MHGNGVDELPSLSRRKLIAANGDGFCVGHYQSGAGHRVAARGRKMTKFGLRHRDAQVDLFPARDLRYP